MANRIIPKELVDWSKIDKNDPFFNGIDTSRDENFGIHSYKGNLWTSGFVGVGRLYGINGRPLSSHGKEHVVVINSKYNLDPWIMLEKVITDNEYDDYINELEKDGKYLFKIFYDQQVVQLSENQRCDAEILYALSFINLCYSLCKKGITKRMLHHEENFTGKIRGKIDIQKNIKNNTFNGRNDRFFCKYVDFTNDTNENRILKATLVRCKKIIEQKFKMNSEIMVRLIYCMNVLKDVKLVTIKKKDFHNTNATGLYSYYKPLIKQAKCIIDQKYISYTGEDGKKSIKSVYTVPYMINMETVFEFYIRTIFKEHLDENKFYVEKYSKKISIQGGLTNLDNAKKGIHLVPYCIPDIIICDKNTQKPVMVLDAKYKQDNRSDRADSHQLLSYVLLTGAEKCGFVLPGEITKLKNMEGNYYIELTAPRAEQLKYYELLIGNRIDTNEINKIF